MKDEGGRMKATRVESRFTNHDSRFLLWGAALLAAQLAAGAAPAQPPPDGYTLVMGSIGTPPVNVSLFSKLAYDPIRDFAPVALVMEAEGLLVLHPSVPVRTVKELIALAKARPGQLSYESAGNGTARHLSGEVF